MGRKKRGNKNPLTPKAEEDWSKGASINAVHRWEDIGGDSEDEFHEQREKILLDGSPSSNEESEHEIMALEGDSDEELARLESLAQKLKPELYKKGVKSDSDSEEEKEQEMDESWGKSRKVYYEGEDISADEEAAKEEEKEALKIQKKRAQTMKEQDFMDDAFDETLMEKYHLHKTPTGMESAQDLSLTDQTNFDITEMQKMSDGELKDLLQNAMPDVIGLTDEFLEKWEYLQETLGPALNWSLDAIQVSDPEELTPIVFCQLKYRLITMLLTNIAYYIHLRSEAVKKGIKINIRNHPVVSVLLRIQQMLQKLDTVQGDEDMVEEAAREIIEASKEAIESEEDISEEDALQEVSEGESEEESDDPSDQEIINEQVSVSNNDALPFDITLEPLPKLKNQKRKRILLDTMQDYGESKEMADIELEDKLAHKKSLKFHLNRMDQLKDAREKKMKKLTGDMDLPRKQRQSFDGPSAEAIQKRQEEAPEDADRFSDYSEEDYEDSDAADALDYFNELDRTKRQKRTQREDAVQNARKELIESIKEENINDDYIEEGRKRAASYKMLKNKGLTPHRKKENRNPRVKRRLKFEKASKKLKDFRRVAVDKHTQGSYAGETTGIKSKLSRSVRL